MLTFLIWSCSSDGFFFSPVNNVEAFYAVSICKELIPNLCFIILYLSLYVLVFCLTFFHGKIMSSS